MIKEAKFTKVNLVNETMITYELELPEGSRLEDFDTRQLEGVTSEHQIGNKIFLCTFLMETEIRPGDLLDEDGDWIEGDERGEITTEEMDDSKEHDYRKAFYEKHGQEW